MVGRYVDAFLCDCVCIYVAYHNNAGQQDEVLPVSCSHRVLSKLQSYGYEVKYEEFTGGHELEEVFVRAGLEVLLANTDHN